MTISIRTGKLRRHLTDSSFVSVLNKTKWNRLIEVLNQSHLPLGFRRKDLGEAESAEQRWDGDMFHVFGGCEAIEWLDIQAKLPINRGKLLKPEVQDSTSELIAVARKAKVPFSLTPDGIRIWGYIRAGADVQWAT